MHQRRRMPSALRVAALRSSAHSGIVGAFGGSLEYLGAVFCADVVHGLVTLVVLAAFFRVPPIPHLFVLAPAAAERLQNVLVCLGISGDPKPVAAQLASDAVQLQQRIDQIPEFLGGFGGLVVFVGGFVVLALQDLKQPVVLVVYCLHGGSIAAAIWMMQLDEAAVFGFQVFQGVAVGEVFHGGSSFRLFTYG